jgi:hypothetical protein
MKKYFHSIVVLLPLMAVLACLPSAGTMEVDMGDGHAVNDPDRIEGALEKTGYARLWIIKNGEKPLPRLQRSGAGTSNFESQEDRGLEAGFVVPIIWHEENGALQVAVNEVTLN